MAPDAAWLTAPSHEALVNIGTHSLYLRVMGPPRSSPSQPVVVLEAGSGASGYGMIAIARSVSKYARVYWYDRSGFGHSEKYPEGTPSTTLNHVHALDRLLKGAGVDPPFVMVGHSYGGNILRLFLEECDGGDEGEKQVAGMLLLDAPPMIPEELPMMIGELLGPEGDYLGAIGLKGAPKLTEEEMKMVESEGTVGAMNGAIMAEFQEVRPSVAELNKRQGVEITDGKVVFTRAVLGDRRLCVLKGGIREDYEKIYDFGLEHGYGSETARQESKKFLDTWPQARAEQLQDALAGLSSNTRLVKAEREGRTHVLTMTVPDFIAENLR